MNRARTGIPKLAFLSLLLAGAPLNPRIASADDRFKFNVVLEGRVATTPVAQSFLDGGLGKTRYGSLSLIHISEPTRPY